MAFLYTGALGYSLFQMCNLFLPVFTGFLCIIFMLVRVDSTFISNIEENLCLLADQCNGGLHRRILMLQITVECQVSIITVVVHDGLVVLMQFLVHHVRNWKLFSVGSLLARRHTYLVTFTFSVTLRRYLLRLSPRSNLARVKIRRLVAKAGRITLGSNRRLNFSVTFSHELAENKNRHQAKSLLIFLQRRRLNLFRCLQLSLSTRSKLNTLKLDL